MTETKRLKRLRRSKGLQKNINVIKVHRDYKNSEKRKRN
jgi:hypothetical protein